MEALRNIYTVENHRIVIDLPESFNYNSVEIIILPIEKQKKNKNIDYDNNERLKKLLSISVWNDEDILPIIETQNFINQ
jgi:predicted Ser/Thr protein kinase